MHLCVIQSSLSFYAWATKSIDNLIFFFLFKMILRKQVTCLHLREPRIDFSCLKQIYWKKVRLMLRLLVVKVSSIQHHLLLMMLMIHRCFPCYILDELLYAYLICLVYRKVIHREVTSHRNRRFAHPNLYVWNINFVKELIHLWTYWWHRNRRFVYLNFYFWNINFVKELIHLWRYWCDMPRKRRWKNFEYKN